MSPEDLINPELESLALGYEGIILIYYIKKALTTQMY